MSIAHISFFLYLRPLRSRSRLQIPGMEPGSPPSSSVVAPLQIPGVDHRVVTCSDGDDPFGP
jgi:hypothetical protein